MDARGAALVQETENEKAWKPKTKNTVTEIQKSKNGFPKKGNAT